jgi:hypothetical protein
MNDRIRELYQQAHSIRYHDGDPMRDGNPPTVYWQGEKSAERFAELIVRECLNQCYNRGMNDELYNGQLKAAAYIEQHFGVESA